MKTNISRTNSTSSECIFQVEWLAKKFMKEVNSFKIYLLYDKSKVRSNSLHSFIESFLWAFFVVVYFPWIGFRTVHYSDLINWRLCHFIPHVIITSRSAEMRRLKMTILSKNYCNSYDMFILLIFKGFLARSRMHISSSHSETTIISLYHVTLNL